MIELGDISGLENTMLKDNANAPGLLEESEDVMSNIENTEDLVRMNKGVDGMALEPEIRNDVPGCDEAWVTGDPHGCAVKMDFNQGDNPYNAAGNCGLVSICNMLRRADSNITEDDVTRCAITNGLCDYDPSGDASSNGGTTLEMRKDVLTKLGISSDIYPSNNGGSLETIADAIDSGKGVVISVNAGALWDCDDGSPTFFGMARSNHCIAVTGIARDASTGEITGVYIADSGRGIPGDSCRYLTVNEFDEVYTDVLGSGANITNEPIMEG